MTQRPKLAPGLRMVTRGRNRVQIGITHERSVVLPRTSTTDAVLGALVTGDLPPDDPASRALLEELTARGVVVSGPARSPRRVPVTVIGSLGVDPTSILEGAGLRVHGGGRAAHSIALVLSSRELDRDLLDPLVRAGTTHLVVRLVDGVTTLGPFVRPGETACLRCLDAHRAEEDPEHLAVLHRYAEACAQPRADGVTDPADPLLATLASCWAVNDLITHLDGGRPATWSSTITLAPGLTDLTATTWLRHPECSCCWPAAPESLISQGFSGTLDR